MTLKFRENNSIWLVILKTPGIIWSCKIDVLVAKTKNAFPRIYVDRKCNFESNVSTAKYDAFMPKILKGQRHEDFAVLGQVYAKSVTYCV